MVGAIKEQKKVLVIGATGLLGQTVYAHFLQKGYDVQGTHNEQKKEGMQYLDLRGERFTAEVIRSINPAIIINCAALSNVDLAEKEKKLAYQINVKGVENIVKECEQRKIIHISTDYVFDGKKGNYQEGYYTNPLNYYGQTKLMAENMIRLTSDNYIIARVAVLYGFGRKNFVTETTKKLENREEIIVVKQKISPTFTPDIAQALEQLISLEAKGTFHITGDSQITRKKMVEIIAEELKIKPNIKLLDSHPNWVAQRPKNTSLNTERIKSLGLKMGTFQEGIKKMREATK
ncbi:SDR family oxidoreductase [Candidatus Woesearchaeota archaeon]|nr:SDR family oxidoreductase [Candidatus Woesearchaeota archaeon]